MLEKLDFIKFRKISNIYKILYNKYTSQIIILLIENKELTVGEIQKNIKISQSQTSQCLAKLRRIKLVNIRRDLNIIYYSLNLDKINLLIKKAEIILN